ncbi:MBL fold metallo-hydrolase [Pseudomarimonas salicorniae]|uniref:MBL fold metallo-hydrolase n=1 Tax=Pseudomarimonas salicorniae TaxID=2933270 RepID=A0ABT0GL77_9GAMM|nr:MBL fold metallo-hydrolase [Lysobacter sp. CAU 1642]
MTASSPTVHVIDTGFHRPRFDAAYLLVHDGRAAFIDCGLNSSVPRLLQALERAGLGVEAVDWLILTHVHLDHAGGAGELMARLPQAGLLVHPRGARHMVDPTALVAGATAVYGAEEVERTYGTLRPVPADRVVEARDGLHVEVGGLRLRCLDAPGHARHHIVIHHEAERAFFTGDTFGLSYRELDGPSGPFILPTTTPVQFDPEALKASILRMLAAGPERMYLTHYGPVDNVERLAGELFEQIDAMVAIARGHADLAPGPRHAALVAALGRLYTERAAAAAVPCSEAEVLELLHMDIELNAQGLGVWLDREAASGR